MEEQIWKDIPGFSKYQASNRGDVRTKKTGHIKAKQEVWVPKGYYYEVSLSDDNCQENTYRVHRLVCMAFHGEPSDTSLVVNHKDSCKHNNNSENLEWVTRSRNAEHAFDNGEHSATRPVTMTDTILGQDVIFPTMKAFERHFSLKHGDGLKVISATQGKLYLGRYALAFDVNRVIVRKSTDVECYCVDLVKGNFYRFENCAQVTLVTGLRSCTVTAILKKNKVRLLNGYIFRTVDRLSDLLRDIQLITQDQVDASIDNFKKFHSTKREWCRYAWLVRNYITGEEFQVGSTGELLELPPFKGMSQHPKQVELMLYKGHSFKRIDPRITFKDYYPEYVNLSVVKNVNAGKPVRVTDLISNTTEDWPSISSFAESMGLNKEYRLKLRDLECRLRDKYSFDKIDMFC